MKTYQVITKVTTFSKMLGDGFMLESVSGKRFPQDDRFFTYKSNNRYYLVDIKTGLALGSSCRCSLIYEDVYLMKLEAYENYIKTKKYEEKVQRFEQLKEIIL